jgi:hypothetical protein
MSMNQLERAIDNERSTNPSGGGCKSPFYPIEVTPPLDDGISGGNSLLISGQHNQSVHKGSPRVDNLTTIQITTTT